MTANALAQLVVYGVALVLLAYPLGLYMARVYTSTSTLADRILGPLERAFYRVAAVEPAKEQTAREYAASVLALSLVGTLALYGLQRFQARLPLNPEGLPAVGPEVAFSTATSFVTNTNWQAYGGETTMSYLVQMLGLTAQNFVSAATGMAVMVALTRGITRREAQHVGNFWVDLTRSILHVLLPLSVVLALLLVGQGVVQTFEAHGTARLLDPAVDADGAPVLTQILAWGPVASQIAIKQLGTNGGGFFNANSAHPFENPTTVSSFFEMLAILLVPAALTFTYGELVKDRRQGVAIFAAMAVLWLGCTLPTIAIEANGNPAVAALGVDDVASADQPGGNMEGKESRFGITGSAIWATATTAASNGSVSSMLDSYMPLGGLGPMWLIQLGEVAFGGVGCGLYGMLLFVFVAVFIAGLMVGRTPEYLGKKVEAFELKMASIGILVPTVLILVTTAVACVSDAGTAPLGNPGAHGFSEILYAMSSAAGNNGSAFAGLTASGPFYATVQGIAMVIARFAIIAVVLAIAGSLAKKKAVPPGPGTMPTHTPLFTVLLVGTVVLLGALSFIPALALGPVAEHLEALAPGPERS